MPPPFREARGATPLEAGHGYEASPRFHPPLYLFKCSVTGSDRSVAEATCPGCGADVWVGWDEDCCAIKVVTDTVPLPDDPLLEATIWLEGRSIYAVLRGPALSALSPVSRPADLSLRIRFPRVATHKCQES